jgi:hypothetical protein
MLHSAIYPQDNSPAKPTVPAERVIPKTLRFPTTLVCRLNRVAWKYQAKRPVTVPLSEIMQELVYLSAEFQTRLRVCSLTWALRVMHPTGKPTMLKRNHM